MGAVEDSSQIVSFARPTSQSAITASSSSVTILHDDLYMADMSVTDFFLNIWSFIHSPHKVTAAKSLRGEEAQRLIDLIDQAITLPELDEKLRKQYLHLLYKMCNACEMLPASHILQQESIQIGTLHCYGGFADVSQGEYLGCRVAIKHLRIRAKGTPSKIFKRFCREIIAWKRLSHPNILPLLGVSFSTDPYSFHMVSAWMQNGDVMEYTRSNPRVNRLQLLSEVMSGTSYLHELGVIHGDLKGGNILVDDNGTALLADFGLATISVDLDTIPLSATTISAAGTARWMSPELFFGQNSPRTRESDCYALGMVIHEVLTGLHPFHHLGPFEVVITVQEGGRPRKPRNADSLGFSDRLWRLVLQSWNRSPSARPTAKMLLRCLQDASNTWVPPLEYPIPNGLDGDAEPDFTFGDEWRVMGTLKHFFFLMVGILCFIALV